MAERITQSNLLVPCDQCEEYTFVTYRLSDFPLTFIFGIICYHCAHALKHTDLGQYQRDIIEHKQLKLIDLKRQVKELENEIENL